MNPMSAALLLLSPSPRSGARRGRKGSRLLLVQHLVHQTERLGFRGGEEVLPLRLAVNLLRGAAGMPGEDIIEGVLVRQDLLDVDVDVRGLAAPATLGLVEHDARVRQGVALSFGPSGEQDCRPAVSRSDAV